MSASKSANKARSHRTQKPPRPCVDLLAVGPTLDDSGHPIYRFFNARSGAEITSNKEKAAMLKRRGFLRIGYCKATNPTTQD